MQKKVAHDETGRENGETSPDEKKGKREKASHTTYYLLSASGHRVMEEHSVPFFVLVSLGTSGQVLEMLPPDTSRRRLPLLSCIFRPKDWGRSQRLRARGFQVGCRPLGHVLPNCLGPRSSSVNFLCRRTEILVEVDHAGAVAPIRGSWCFLN